ncbi:unnamed protein product, partial [marine sediment metagenome]
AGPEAAMEAAEAIEEPAAAAPAATVPAEAAPAAQE